MIELQYLNISNNRRIEKGIENAAGGRDKKERRVDLGRERGAEGREVEMRGQAVRK